MMCRNQTQHRLRDTAQADDRGGSVEGSGGALPSPYQPRYRRDCRGELIHIAGSKHCWLEDRGPQCTLLVYIDDATSELMRLKIMESESTWVPPSTW